MYCQQQIIHNGLEPCCAQKQYYCQCWEFGSYHFHCWTRRLTIVPMSTELLDRLNNNDRLVLLKEILRISQCQTISGHKTVGLHLTLSYQYFFLLAKMSIRKPYCSNPPFLNFWHLGTLALSPECQSARMSKKLKMAGYTSMAMNALKCNHLASLDFKG